MDAVASDIDRSMELVNEISAAFQARFKQDPVFRMWNTACAGITGDGGRLDNMTNASECGIDH